jgi:chemotaxis protein methyltransferase CheR
MLVESVPTLTDGELAGIVRLVYEKSGITLHAGKRALIVARLHSRLRSGGYQSFSAYLKAVQSDRSGRELGLLLDAIATNHTSFYREPQHFAFLQDTVVPRWRAARTRPLQIWSAACSSGEEPYTIAMTLTDCGAMARARCSCSRRISRRRHWGARAPASIPWTRCSRSRSTSCARLLRKGRRHAGGNRPRAAARRARVQFEQLNLLEITDLGQPLRRDLLSQRDDLLRQVRAAACGLDAGAASPARRIPLHLASESLNGISHGLHWVAPAIYEWRRQ